MNSILNLSVPRERFTHAIEHGPEHLRLIMGAARDHGVGVCVVPQGAERFNPPRKRPNILIVETRLKFEPAWKTFIELHHPGIALLLCTVEPQGGVQ